MVGLFDEVGLIGQLDCLVGGVAWSVRLVGQLDCTHIFLHAHSYIHSHKCTHTPTYTHTQIYTHTHLLVGITDQLGCLVNWGIWSVGLFG